MNVKHEEEYLHRIIKYIYSIKTGDTGDFLSASMRNVRRDNV